MTVMLERGKLQLLCMAAHDRDTSVTVEASASVLTPEKVPLLFMVPSDLMEQQKTIIN